MVARRTARVAVIDQASRLEWCQAQQYIDRLTKDFVWTGGGNSFDLHPPNGTHEAQRLPELPINHQPTVQFLRNLTALFDQHALDDLPLWPGLWGDQMMAQECYGTLLHLSGAGGDTYPPTFATSSRMDLGFDHPAVATEGLGYPACCLWRGPGRFGDLNAPRLQPCERLPGRLLWQTP